MREERALPYFLYGSEAGKRKDKVKQKLRKLEITLGLKKKKKQGNKLRSCKEKKRNKFSNSKL